MGKKAEISRVKTLPPALSNEHTRCLVLSQKHPDEIQMILSGFGIKQLDHVEDSARGLLIEINIQGAERSELLIGLADKTLKDIAAAHVATRDECEKIRRAANVRIWSRFW